MAARKNKQKTEENSREKSSFNVNFISKIFRPLKILIKIHAKIASRELKKDLGRFITGIMDIIFGLLFISTAWILLNVVAVLVLNEVFKMNNMLYSVSVVAGFNLLISLILFISSILKFKKPFLKETKKLIQDSLKEFKEDE